MCIRLLFTLIFMLFFLLILTSSNLNSKLCSYIWNNPIFTRIILYFCHNALMDRFKSFINVCITSKSWILSFFKSLNNSCNLFFIIGLVLANCNSGSKIFKILTVKRCIQLSKEFDCTYLSTLSVVGRKISSNLVTFLRFFSSLIDLKHSLKFMAAKSFVSSSVKIFK